MNLSQPDENCLSLQLRIWQFCSLEKNKQSEHCTLRTKRKSRIQWVSLAVPVDRVFSNTNLLKTNLFVGCPAAESATKASCTANSKIARFAPHGRIRCLGRFSLFALVDCLALSTKLVAQKQHRVESDFSRARTAALRHPKRTTSPKRSSRTTYAAFWLDSQIWSEGSYLKLKCNRKCYYSLT